MPKFKLQSSQLIDRLQGIRDSAASTPVEGALLSVDESAVWWGYHEFGTASKQELGDAENVASTQHPDGYPILPVNAKGIRLPEGGGYDKSVVFPYVGNPGDGRPQYTENHPGVKPLALVRSVLSQIRQTAGKAIASVLQRDNYQTAAVKSALVEEVMPEVRRLIVESIGEKMHAGTSPTSKLGGSSPSEVFEAAASISESSGESL